MHMKLHDIATVIAGYTFRGAIEPDLRGDVSVFQAKDLVQGVPLTHIEHLTKISLGVQGRSGFIQIGDVLLVARGMKLGAFRSTVFAADAANVIASSSIHIIRITDESVIPEYLSHYLNSNEGQFALSEIVTGSYIGAVPRSALEKVKVPIPTLQKQKAIVELHRNIREQQRIMNRQSEINQNIINATFKNLTSQV